jgi:hypothetical protein
MKKVVEQREKKSQSDPFKKTFLERIRELLNAGQSHQHLIRARLHWFAGSEWKREELIQVMDQKFKPANPKSKINEDANTEFWGGRSDQYSTMQAGASLSFDEEYLQMCREAGVAVNSPTAEQNSSVQAPNSHELLEQDPGTQEVVARQISSKGKTTTELFLSVHDYVREQESVAEDKAAEEKSSGTSFPALTGPVAIEGFVLPEPAAVKDIGSSEPAAVQDIGSSQPAAGRGFASSPEPAAGPDFASTEPAAGRGFASSPETTDSKDIASSGPAATRGVAISGSTAGESSAASGLVFNISFAVSSPPAELRSDSRTPATETPAAENSAVETPVTETPAAENSAVETPVTETPAAENSAVETPDAETPASENTAVETPDAEKAAVETPDAEKAAVETPVSDAPPAETVAGEKPFSEQVCAESGSANGSACQGEADTPEKTASASDERGASAKDEKDAFAATAMWSQNQVFLPAENWDSQESFQKLPDQKVCTEDPMPADKEAPPS